MPLNLTWVDLVFSCTKGYPGQVKRHSLLFQLEAALKYLVVPLTFAHDCTYIIELRERIYSLANMSLYESDCLIGYAKIYEYGKKLFVEELLRL